MSQQELVEKVIEALETAGIGYMLTGSLVSSMQGEARTTHDIDIVIALQEKDIGSLTAAFSAQRYYLNEETIIQAIRTHSPFNLLDIDSGEKADFWILTDEPFDKSRFSRRYSVEIMGMSLQVSSPEDTILAKLRWAKMSGGSEKHFVDALRVYEVQEALLDIDYVKHWVRELHVEELWERLQKGAQVEG